jgi:hypothetical protein
MKTDILQLAKQGDAEAIAALMNHSLAALGITLQAEVKAGCLIISAASTSAAPNRTLLLERLYQGLQKLQPVGITRAIVRGYVSHSPTPEWIDGFDLPSYTNHANTTIASQQRRGYASKKPLLSRFSSSLRSGLRWLLFGDRKASHAKKKAKKPTNPSPPTVEQKPSSPSKSTKSYSQTQIFLSTIFFFIRFGLYLLAISCIVLLTFEMKFQATWFVEKNIYTIPAVGDFLRGVEMVEIANVFIFAILGMGIGIATILLPRGLTAKLSMLFLLIAIPLVFVASPLVKYEFWIENFAEAESVSIQKAQTITNSFLQERVEADGVWGFYLYSAQFPVIPTRVDRLQEVEELKVQIAGKVANIAQLKLQQVSLMFKICNWGIRGFYAVLAAIVAWFHFFKGLETIRWKQRSAS